MKYIHLESVCGYMIFLKIYPASTDSKDFHKQVISNGEQEIGCRYHDKMVKPMNVTDSILKARNQLRISEPI